MCVTWFWLQRNGSASWESSACCIKLRKAWSKVLHESVLSLRRPLRCLSWYSSGRLQPYFYAQEAQLMSRIESIRCVLICWTLRRRKRYRIIFFQVFFIVVGDVEACWKQAGSSECSSCRAQGGMFEAAIDLYIWCQVPILCWWNCAVIVLVKSSSAFHNR